MDLRFDGPGHRASWAAVMGGAKGAFGAQVGYGSAASPGAASATAVTGLSSRQVLFGGSSGGIAQDAELQWDSTAKRLGIGTSAPGARVHAVKTSTGSLAYAIDADDVIVAEGSTGSGNVLLISG